VWALYQAEAGIGFATSAARRKRASTPVRRRGVPDLALTKAVDDPTPPERGSIVYTISLTNNGPSSAANVQVTDLLPAGVTFVSTNATSGSYDDATGAWDIDVREAVPVQVPVPRSATTLNSTPCSMRAFAATMT
jgi:uncharacterized repeat protein (TIGR01451 family)